MDIAYSQCLIEEGLMKVLVYLSFFLNNWRTYLK